MTSEELIERAGRALAAAAPPASRVILFGSHARGDEGAGSDLDFLVIEPDADRSGLESVRLRRALRDLPASIDVVVVSREVAERRSKVPCTMVDRAPRVVSSPGPEQREYAALLLRKAGGDLRAATTLRDAGLDDELVGFHAQQAVKKAAKAVLVLAGVEIPRTHDLERVLTLAEQAGHQLPDPRRGALLPARPVPVQPVVRQLVHVSAPALAR